MKLREIEICNDNTKCHASWVYLAGEESSHIVRLPLLFLSKYLGTIVDTVE